MKKTIIILTILVLTITSFVYHSSATELNGKEILDRADTLESINDFKAEMKMTIVHKSGKERLRKLIMKSLEKDNGVEMSLMHFLEPSDVRGTGFLNIKHPKASDESYLYLPAMGKPRRISSEERGGNFMGSDFSYEDISFTLDDYNHKLISTEEVDGKKVYIVESTPKTNEIKRDVGFSKRRSFITKNNYLLLKSEYFNEKGHKIKLLKNSNFKEVNSNVWLITHMVMENLERGSKTILEYSDFELNTGLTEDDFTIRQLTRPI